MSTYVLSQNKPIEQAFYLTLQVWHANLKSYSPFSLLPAQLNPTLFRPFSITIKYHLIYVGVIETDKCRLDVTAPGSGCRCFKCLYTACRERKAQSAFKTLALANQQEQQCLNIWSTRCLNIAAFASRHQKYLSGKQVILILLISKITHWL